MGFIESISKEVRTETARRSLARSVSMGGKTYV